MVKSKFLPAIALLLNFFGTGMVAWSFQATSSHFRFITATNMSAQGTPSPAGKAYAICADRLMLAGIATSGAYAVVPGRPICGILGSRPRHWRAREGLRWRGDER
jgi:hypothetical protein